MARPAHCGAMLKLVAILLLTAQIVAIGVLTRGARTLAEDLTLLDSAVAGSAMAEREDARERRCEAAVWPAIPQDCLERVSAAETVGGIY